ncbi:phosphatidylserine/phosphatidylglycerophosphate/cardiolipin synthase [Desulfosporosinus orientis DSM 765]|uniref:Cardiolipin synthase n=1 Tax=Desulfosporosinus orientis (strain ATCC 19365 / DSM 765 / NCIMB 8382 / VKM B-1628 / Singapore I) TaxID=768706 RepID=G7WDL9_DESOD|nr:cardiolipin synthase [Desulfosporosinus orientis]AET68344.1 phosphatidylserine/phosphatidylglycerophosphate/cardiolipin synthase [Desulfosporosinus orientis DSM 765]
MIGYLMLLISLLQVVLLGREIILENRSPGNTVTWIFILALFPVLGLILYILFGKSTHGPMFHGKHYQDNPINRWVSQQQFAIKNKELLSHREMNFDLKLLNLHLNSGFAPLTINNQAEILLNGGEKFKALFYALEKASHHIHLSYFIFNDDEIGEDVLKILSRKVTEGVAVRVILDGMGSLSISGTMMRRMKTAGIQAKWFFPIQFPYLTSKLNLRYHRKIVVVDGSIGFIGGLNIGDEYLSRDSKLGFWRDTHLKLQGEAVHAIQAVFLNDWYYVTRQQIKGEHYFPKTKISQMLPIQILASGPDSKWNSILYSFFSSITMAKESIYIETPYFIPDQSLIIALKTAALSGLDVQLIVQGIPEHKFTYLAMNSYFEELLQAGVKIFQYMKGTLHAKILIIDNHLALVGSANMDIRSFFLDFEISAFIYDPIITEELINYYDLDLKDCNKVILEEFQHRSSIEKFKESSARLLSSLL